MRHRFPFVAILLVVMLLLSACSVGGDDSDDASPTAEELTAETVLQRASDRWNETDGLHFVLEAEGDTYLDSDRTILLRSGEGDLARPESVSASARVDVMITTVNVNIIAIGNDAYMTNLISGDWERAPEDFTYNPGRLFNPDDGLGTIMENIQNPNLDGSESVDGRDAHRVTGTVTGDQIHDITSGSIEGDQIAVTLWIAEDNYDVLRLLISAPGAEDAGETTWNLQFSNHDEDVTIEAPI